MNISKESKQSRVTSKSQTHSQIMNMIKSLEEYGRNIEIQRYHTHVLGNEILIAQLGSNRSKSDERVGYGQAGIIMGADGNRQLLVSEYAAHQFHHYAAQQTFKVIDGVEEADEPQKMTYKRAILVFDKLIGLIYQ